MTPDDDHDLIDQLRSGIAQRRADISAPPGIGALARRTARRRTAARALTAGVPVLAAAGVTTVLATGSGSGPAHHAPARDSVATSPTGPVRTVDATYIIGRIRARLAHDTNAGTVMHQYSYTGGTVSSDGAFEDPGLKYFDGYQYLTANGTSYQHNTDFNDNGRVALLESFDWIAGPGGKGTFHKILIDPTQRIYSQTAYPKTPSQDEAPSPSLTSSPAQVRQGLQSAQVTQTGTATIDGVRAIALSVVTPRTKGTKLILYVDAQTYQPLRTVQTIDGLPGLMVADWEPATPANIALAQDDSVPAGFKRVSVNTVAPIHPIHHH